MHNVFLCKKALFIKAIIINLKTQEKLKRKHIFIFNLVTKQEEKFTKQNAELHSRPTHKCNVQS